MTSASRAMTSSGWRPASSLALVKGEYRTSNIVEPANGQLPFKDPAGQMKKAMEGFRVYMTGKAPYEGPEEPTLSERCLIGFGQTGGPGMLSVLYNNNYQFVQTPDHMMILVEMAHDARIVPIFKSAEEARQRPQAGDDQAVAGRYGRLVGWRHVHHGDDQHQPDAGRRAILPGVGARAW